MPSTRTHPGLNFRPSSDRKMSMKGTKPLPEPLPVHHVVLLIAVHMCKKVLLFDIRYKVGIYLGVTFLFSIIADVMPFPKTYFSDSKNFLNRIFRSFGWGFVLILMSLFIYLTSMIFLCGDRRKIFLKHVSRMVIATGMWFLCLEIFSAIESQTGICTQPEYKLKSQCVAAKHRWRGFDISGHAFLAIFANLIMMEEAKVIVGWENIREMIRREDYNRDGEGSDEDTCLKSLTNIEFSLMKHYFERYTLYIRLLFIWMTFHLLVHDMLLLATLLYFHIMTEKLFGCLVALVSWFILYHLWFLKAPFPTYPGNGMFSYAKSIRASAKLLRNQSLTRRPLRENQTPFSLGRSPDLPPSRSKPREESQIYTPSWRHLHDASMSSTS